MRLMSFFPYLIRNYCVTLNILQQGLFSGFKVTYLWVIFFRLYITTIWIKEIECCQALNTDLASLHLLILSFYFILENSWFTMLCYFQIFSKVIQLHICIYLFFLKFTSHIDYYRALREFLVLYTIGPYLLPFSI